MLDVFLLYLLLLLPVVVFPITLFFQVYEILLLEPPLEPCPNLNLPFPTLFHILLLLFHLKVSYYGVALDYSKRDTP